MKLPKDSNSLLVFNAKLMETYNLINKEFKNHLKETQCATRKHRQFHKTCNTVHKQNGNFDKEIKIIKKNQTDSGVENYNE